MPHDPGPRRPKFGSPGRSARPPGVRSTGGAWPGHWTICRDEVAETVHGDWRGTSLGEFPWGRVEDIEHLTYDVADARPEAAKVAGSATTTITLEDRVLVWSAQLEVSSDAKSFTYRLKRELRKDGVLIREKTWQETFPRDFQ